MSRAPVQAAIKDVSCRSSRQQAAAPELALCDRGRDFIDQLETEGVPIMGVPMADRSKKRIKKRKQGGFVARPAFELSTSAVFANHGVVAGAAAAGLAGVVHEGGQKRSGVDRVEAAGVQSDLIELRGGRLIVFG